MSCLPFADSRRYSCFLSMRVIFFKGKSAEGIRFMEKLNSKQRSFLIKLGAKESPVFQIGKAGLTPEVTEAVSEALAARELVKIGVLKNCFDDLRETAETLAARTRSQVVTVIGRKIILYRPSDTKKEIILP